MDELSGNSSDFHLLLLYQGFLLLLSLLIVGGYISAGSSVHKMHIELCVGTETRGHGLPTSWATKGIKMSGASEVGEWTL